ncbi:MAG: hypothetical protein K2P58_05970 [Hyphomonadaceae bacterium]|nr:hypothetical protein [Hyphomonadaceae bacterium]
MRIAAPPQHDTAPLDAFVASMRGWLPLLQAWLAQILEHVEPLARRSPFIAAWVRWAKARVIADLRRTTSCLRAYLMCAAFGRLRRIPRPRHCGARAGQRPLRRLRRAATAGLLHDIHRGSLRERTERIARLFSQRETLIGRVGAQLRALYRAGPKSRMRVVVAGSASIPPAPATAALCADTS